LEDAMTIARLVAGRSGPVWKIHAEDTVADAVELLAERRIGALPVEDVGAEVAGIFPNATFSIHSRPTVRTSCAARCAM
jgi:CBS domain-containing protein